MEYMTPRDILNAEPVVNELLRRFLPLDKRLDYAAEADGVRLDVLTAETAGIPWSAMKEPFEAAIEQCGAEPVLFVLAQRTVGLMKSRGISPEEVLERLIEHGTIWRMEHTFRLDES